MHTLTEICTGLGLAPDTKLGLSQKMLPTPKGDGLRHLPGKSPNPSLYEQSKSFGSSIESDYLDDPDCLHNPVLPQIEILHEKIEHRIICFLKAQGFAHNEIAEKTGYSVIHIGNILRQPWAAKRVIEEIQKAGRDEVEILLKGHAKDAVQVLINEMNNHENARASERIAAADKLLDRLYGKPNQAIALTAKVAVTNDMSDEQLTAIALGQANVTSTS